MKFRSERILALSLFVALLTGAAFVKSSSPAGSAEASREEEIARAAESLRAKLIEQRRDFHMRPELSNREERTSRVVAERLGALGLDEIKTGVGKYSVVALLKGKLPGGVVAVRADMDALPIQETINVPYKSRNDGVKHACGHDAHMTVQLGVAELLSKMRDQIRGSIKFIFQPAEEGAPAGERGGAKLMIEEGCLENPRPSAIFGLHVMPNIFLGVGNKGKGITAMIHTPEFDLDEESLVIGVKLMSNVLLDYLDRATIKK